MVDAENNQRMQGAFHQDPQVLAPPPPLLMKLVVGGAILFAIGVLAGVIIFQQMLRPGQQQRVINSFPFMTAFLPSRPDPGETVPTPLPRSFSVITVEDLWSSTEEPTPRATTTVTSPAIIALPTVAPTLTAPVALTATPEFVATAIAISTAIPETIGPPPALEPERPMAARLNGFTPVQQTWNNCGPATMTMALSYFGWTGTQEIAASFLKPEPEDKNVTPPEMVALVNEQTDVRAVTRAGGSLELVKTLIARGFPVIISIGFMPEGEDWLGHYRLIVGYDDARQAAFAYDSYLGTGDSLQGIAISYEQLIADWRPFNQTFIVLYQPAQEEEIREALGDLADPAAAAAHALDRARKESRENPRDGFAWFNIGTALVALERYEEAAVAYDEARRAGLPWRMLWYQFGPYEAYFNTGRYDDVLALVQVNLNNGGAYVEETYYWQGRVYAAQGRMQDAEQAFRNALQANARYTAAQQALATLSDA